MRADVLFDATPLGRGHAARGIGASVRGMAEGLAGLPPDQRPAFLVTGDGEDAPLIPERYSVRWPDVRIPRTPDPFGPTSVTRRVRSLSPRLFHSTSPDLMPTGLRFVVTVHDLIPAAYPRLFMHGASRATEARRYRRWMGRLSAAELVLCPSQETADDVVTLAGVDAGRTRVIPWGCPPLALPAGEVPDAPYALMSGGLEPHKNPWPVVSALARLPQPLRLVVTGPWGARRARMLRDFANREGVLHRVDPLGMVPASHLSALRRDAVVVVVPSLKEGFGFPMLEAMAAGVPVVASDTPALRALGGDAARYENPFSADAWADAIAEAWQEPDIRKAASIGGPSRAQLFTWERTTALLTEAYAAAR